MHILGIDPSLSSTGIYSNKRNEYWLICSKPTKKLQNSKIKGLNVLAYDYTPQTNLTGPEREQSKTVNVYNIITILRGLLKKLKPDRVILEAVAFNAGGTIDSLAGLNYGIRCCCLDLNIPFFVLSPTTVKKHFVGNGGANKELMIGAWKAVEPRSERILSVNKGDDLADAYALCHFPEEFLP